MCGWVGGWGSRVVDRAPEPAALLTNHARPPLRSTIFSEAPMRRLGVFKACPRCPDYIAMQQTV